MDTRQLHSPSDSGFLGRLLEVVDPPQFCLDVPVGSPALIPFVLGASLASPVNPQHSFQASMVRGILPFVLPFFHDWQLAVVILDDDPIKHW